MEKEGLLGKTIDSLFSMKKESLLLLLIFILAFTLRLIAAINLGVTADDMHHVTFAINFYRADRLITYEQSAGLWHAFTSIMYNVFGTTQLASRIAPLLFGSFSVLVIYLLTKEFFNKKVALIAAFLLAIAPFHIKNTIAEMDVMAMFFSLLAMFLFIMALKSGKYSHYAISGASLGLAIYTKVYPLLFVPSFILFFIYFKNKRIETILTKSNLKKIILFLVITAIFAIPALTHNYLLYEDKGFLDLHFTRTLGLGKDISTQYYSWDPIFDRSNSWAGLIFGDTDHIVSGTPLLLGAINFIRQGDPVNFYFGILGIFLIFYKKIRKDYLIFFLVNILFILPFLASSILLSKHYLFLELFLIPLAAFSVYELNKKISDLLRKNVTKFLIFLLLLSSLILLGMAQSAVVHFYGKSHIGQMIDFKESSIPENSLVVADSRIYRGRTNWALHDRPYLEGSDFVSLISQQEQIEGETEPIEVFFIECVPDDCGWGGGQVQGEFNASMESLTDFFKQNGKLVKKIYEPQRSEKYYPFMKNKEHIINIYEINLPIKTQIINLANQPKSWWIYNIGFEPKERQFDYYETRNSLDSLLNSLAHWIVLIALILAFLSPLYVIYLIYKN